METQTDVLVHVNKHQVLSTKVILGARGEGE